MVETGRGGAVTPRRTDYDRVARAIVDVARRAPSVDNTQPWTWCPDRADLELLAKAGCDYALVASALHDGRLTAAEMSI